MTINGYSRRAVLVGLAIGVAGCARNFKVAYDHGMSDAKTWSVKRVKVSAPSDLTVSDENTWIPTADIVWHGDPAGDRRAQVSKIVEQGVIDGARGLKGPVPVELDVQITRLHAITPISYNRAPPGTGVHSVSFIVTVRNAATGQVLVEGQNIQADMPASVAADSANLTEMQSVGAHQKAEITRQISSVIQGWLGNGPDIRKTFSRVGG